jgi:hypothetical protein
MVASIPMDGTRDYAFMNDGTNVLFADEPTSATVFNTGAIDVNISLIRLGQAEYYNPTQGRHQPFITSCTVTGIGSNPFV